MKAPDKIYIQPNAHDKWWDGNKPNDNFQEYIHKEALLEWLESKVYEHNEDRFDDGFNAALGQIIDKINEL